jgi:hypothetical protein
VGPISQRERKRGAAGGSSWAASGRCWAGPSRVVPVAGPFLFFCSETFSIFCFQFCLIYLFETNLFGFGLNFNFVKLWQLCLGVCQTNNVLFGEVLK